MIGRGLGKHRNNCVHLIIGIARMKLRKELEPPEFQSELISRLVEIVEDVDRRYRNKQDYSNLLIEFRNITGVELNFREVVIYLNTLDPGIEAIIRYAITKPPKLDDITDEEYLEIIRRILKHEYNDEHAYSFYLDLLHVNLCNPHISDAFREDSGQELSPESVLKKAREYKPICL